MPKFYHFCKDEKFINSAYKQFEAIYPGENVFNIYNSEDGKVEFITLNQNFRFIEAIRTEFQAVPENTVAIFHGLTDRIIPELKYFDTSVKLVWFAYGFEVYNDSNFYSENKSLDKITKKLFKTSENSSNSKIREIIWPYFRLIKPNLYRTKKERKREGLERVDFIGCSFREEHKQITKLLGFERPFFDFWYYPLEDILDVNAPISEAKDKILVGNSAYPSGNHLDVFEKLDTLKIKGENILIPFSYGLEIYKKEVKKRVGLKENNVVFMEEFLSLESYNKILSEVKTAIFNTRRQQAVGNIIALIYGGSKVFISTKNPFYHFLKNNGVKVYAYENELNTENLNSKLSIQEVEQNREILFQILNRERLNLDLKNSIEIALAFERKPKI